jgi:hypothetical protein
MDRGSIPHHVRFTLCKEPVQIDWRLGGFRAWLYVYRKSCCLWALEPHMAQPIVIHYTDYTIPDPWKYKEYTVSSRTLFQFVLHKHVEEVSIHLFLYKITLQIYSLLYEL